MLRYILVFFISFFNYAVYSQVVINELDCDTPGTDTLEFLELKSDTPNYALDGYVVVFFNSSVSGANTSYLALDLDGYTTDVNGLLLIGSTSVSPFPQYVIEENLIQNGPDAIAIYQADAIDFPFGTLAYVDMTLIDVLLYDTADADDADLIAIFDDFDPLIQQINEGSANNTNSIQRKNDGTYESKTPTPRQLNDGSGIMLNGVLIEISQTSYLEGEAFNIDITFEQAVLEDVAISLTLDNGTFNTSDYTGDTSLTILNGETSISTLITLTDDSLDEGDEELIVALSNLGSQYLFLNNNLLVRVVDNDYQVASWGTPVNPTYGLVSSTQPADYYDDLNGLSNTLLKEKIQDIIAEEGLVRAQTYNDVITILNEADQNPENSNEVWMVYLEAGRAKLDYQTTSNNLGKWNREHTYPRSRGGFNNIDADDNFDGKDVFWNTTADSLRHANSDAHAIRVADGPENSSRGNKHYGDYIGPTGTQESFYGDVARSVLYLEIRYNGLQVVNGYPDDMVIGQLGDLQTLLEWHRNDPPDDYEMHRNNVVYQWQFNRNPFVDEPDLVEYIWGNMVGQIWDKSLSVSDINDSKIKISPNPTYGIVNIKGIKKNMVIDLYSIDGKKIKNITTGLNTSIDLSLSRGVYVLKIVLDDTTLSKKLVVK